ncbi:MAG: hypothetical protein WCO63_04325 [Bacteroidota bacterium]
MKSYRILILALSIFAIGFSSCKKDADTSFANSVSATIDGIGYYSDSIVSIGSAEIMNFTSAVGKEKIILYISSAATTGSHALNNNTYNILYFNKNGIIYMPKSGNINISSYDVASKVIKGSFSATLNNGSANAAITNGAFQIKY